MLWVVITTKPAYITRKKSDAVQLPDSQLKQQFHFRNICLRIKIFLTSGNRCNWATRFPASATLWFQKHLFEVKNIPNNWRHFEGCLRYKTIFFNKLALNVYSNLFFIWRQNVSSARYLDFCRFYSNSENRDIITDIIEATFLFLLNPC